VAAGARLLRCLDLFDEIPGELSAAVGERWPDLRLEARREGMETHLLLTERDPGGGLDDAEAWLRTRLGPLLYGVDAETFPLATARALREAGLQVALAESLTAGLAAALLAEAPGASEVLLGAAVTYATRLKREWLDVPASVLDERGPVCGEVAEAMARGVLRLAGADLAVSLTGWAGPDPGEDGQPAGTVFLALAERAGPVHVERRVFSGSRAEVREAAAHRAVDLLRRRALGLPLAGDPTSSGELPL